MIKIVKTRGGEDYWMYEWFLIGSEELFKVITNVRRALEILNAENAI